MHLWTSIFQNFPPAELPAGGWKRASLRPSGTGSKSGHTRCDFTMQKTEPLSIRHDFARIADIDWENLMIRHEFDAFLDWSFLLVLVNLQKVFETFGTLLRSTTRNFATNAVLLVVSN